MSLDYLEKKGDQMGYCGNCKTVFSATYKKDSDRLSWELYFEKSLTKKKLLKPRGCGTPILVIVLVILALLAMRDCEMGNPEQPLEERPAGQLQN